ncbi:MAG: glyoxalase/bleomycin resistance/dioxygenase family protein [Chloroflexi bacterium AL-W]|nr:glyoxalase/bleomycin resistance/dioxygenase family protein [Chloroflexi bacterium AL-N1]NOK70459.1 glyoxalase/bleomycin resistance/dioxygenase family protein [Chloroflexi bacterium AL-N10]NOK78182.1 glyoxalase/bleomycin resistance/dioxygenase family protein [Chloroflexi bacterium AL-N5]NOK85281.1 glyoxalase/bleomycin resistance/dioxygenase family protein [Chloroflexi bacterium AL-W]NOK92046.1 glyoxalase/bleomycin resistance/dioxygenase family protein [Chloroflexi bacterium AL-N15]
MTTRYVHTNLIARDWQRLAAFYEAVFGCVPIPPERNLAGMWLDQATGITNARLTGIHLRLPGYGDNGPTLEVFQYDPLDERLPTQPNTAGFAHIAFAVDDVATVVSAVFKLGGSAVGKLTRRAIPGVGQLMFQYVADPEGNIIEIQKWDLNQ